MKQGQNRLDTQKVSRIQIDVCENQRGGGNQIHDNWPPQIQLAPVRHGNRVIRPNGENSSQLMLVHETLLLTHFFVWMGNSLLSIPVMGVVSVLWLSQLLTSLLRWAPCGFWVPVSLESTTLNLTGSTTGLALPNPSDTRRILIWMMLYLEERLLKTVKHNSLIIYCCKYMKRNCRYLCKSFFHQPAIYHKQQYLSQNPQTSLPSFPVVH